MEQRARVMDLVDNGHTIQVTNDVPMALDIGSGLDVVRITVRNDSGGHIAGVISPPTKNRGYWINEEEKNDADAWLVGATKNEGSWWLDWIPWLVVRSGEQVTPPEAAGNDEFQPIMDAPGTYVLEK